MIAWLAEVPASDLGALLSGMTAAYAHAAMLRRRDSAPLTPLQPASPPADAGTERTMVEQAIRNVLGELAALAGRHRVRLEFAVQPGLLVRGEQGALEALLRSLLLHLLSGSACERVLVTAARVDGRVEVAVTHASRLPEWDAAETATILLDSAEAV